MKKLLSAIPVSVLDLAMVVEGRSIADTFANSADLAKKAERWGYNRYWLAEHHNMEGVASSATSVLIGFIASQTRSMRVGSGGIMLPNHAPLVIAEQFGTLASIYPNRIDLGLGRAPGTDALTTRALRRDQGAAYDFAGTIAELQRFLSSTNSTSPVRAIPGEGIDIPLWVLGSSTDSAHVAAALGLPYAFAGHFAPAELQRAIAIYREQFRPSAQLSKPYVLCCVSAIAADTEEEAARLATSFKRHYLGIITGKRGKLRPPVDPAAIEFSPQEEAALQQMTLYSFIGDAVSVKKRLQNFLDNTQADELMISCAVHEHAARLRSYEILGGFFGKQAL